MGVAWPPLAPPWIRHCQPLHVPLCKPPPIHVHSIAGATKVEDGSTSSQAQSSDGVGTGAETSRLVNVEPRGTAVAMYGMHQSRGRTSSSSGAGGEFSTDCFFLPDSFLPRSPSSRMPQMTTHVNGGYWLFRPSTLLNLFL
jgi:hypothetical protein